MTDFSLSRLRRRHTLLLAALAAFVPAGSVLAQEFPIRPVTLVVPYPPGSATDLLARMLQPKLSEAFKQPVVVENRPGASTNVGNEYVARSAPDGHTILIGAPNLATNEFAFSALRWKREDFAPVTTLVRWSNVLVAGPSATVRDAKELIALGKTGTASMNYGSSGQGSLSHLAVETLKFKYNLGLEHITFTGPGPMMTSLLGGHVQYGATNPASFMRLAQDGKHKLTPLMVLGSQRDSTIPDVPAMAELGFSGVESHGWLGAVVPAKTPAPVIERLNAELLKALRSPDVQERLKSNFLESTGSTPEEFGQFLQSENRKWGAAFKAAGVKPE